MPIEGGLAFLLEKGGGDEKVITPVTTVLVFALVGITNAVLHVRGIGTITSGGNGKRRSPMKMKKYVLVCLFLIFLFPTSNALSSDFYWAFLFSDHDKMLRHYRRYGFNQLKNLMTSQNLKFSEGFHFFTFLFIIRTLQVIAEKIGIYKFPQTGIGNWRFGEKNLISKFLTFMLILDFKINRFLTKFNLIIPGLSLCMIYQNTKSA